MCFQYFFEHRPCSRRGELAPMRSNNTRFLKQKCNIKNEPPKINPPAETSPNRPTPCANRQTALFHPPARLVYLAESRHPPASDVGRPTPTPLRSTHAIKFLNIPLCQTLDGGPNISLENKNTCGSPSCMTATLLRGGVVCSSFRQPPCRDRWTRSADPPARIAQFYPPSLICRIRVR